jgi:hypothetical protein
MIRTIAAMFPKRAGWPSPSFLAVVLRCDMIPLKRNSRSHACLHLFRVMAINSTLFI